MLQEPSDYEHVIGVTAGYENADTLVLFAAGMQEVLFNLYDITQDPEHARYSQPRTHSECCQDKAKKMQQYTDL